MKDPQFGDEAQVNILHVVAGIQEDEQHHQLLAPVHVVPDDVAELRPLLVRKPGVPVAGKVHEVPVVVDEEMVDELRLARGLGGLRQAGIAGQGVDERGLAHVGAADEGELGELPRGLLFHPGAAAGEYGGLDLHGPPDFPATKIRNYFEILGYRTVKQAPPKVKDFE